ncbi:MAG: type II secretion system F family protein [Mycobacteriales bacterium]
MNALVPVMLVVGAACGTGVFLLALAIRGRPADEAQGLKWPALSGRAHRLAAAVIIAGVVIAVTRWVAVALALGLLTAVWSRLFGGGKQEAIAVLRIEALATWTESLRDMTATGIALPDALPASVVAVPPVIRPELLALLDRVRDKEPLDVAVLRFADALDDATADHIVAALVLNARAQGRQLRAVLTALAQSARAELEVRRRVEAERRSSRQAVRIMMGATIAMTLGLFFLNRSYVAPYSTLPGQLVLFLVVFFFGAAFAWLRRLSVFRKADRFLGAPTTRGAVPAGSGQRR